MTPTMEIDAILAEFSASRRKQDAVIQLAQKTAAATRKCGNFCWSTATPTP